MRKVKIVFRDDKSKEIAVRGLTRNEVKAFKKDGHRFSPGRIDLTDQKAMDAAEEKAEQLMDAVLEKVLSAEDLKDLGEIENKYAKMVVKACMKETFGDPDEEKNL